MPAGVPVSAKANIAQLRRHAQLHQYAILLATELTLILIYPLFGRLARRDQLFHVLGLVIFSAAFYAVLGRGRVTLVAVLLGVPALGLRVFSVVTNSSRVQVLDQALGVMFLAFVTGVLIFRIVSNPSVTTDTLAGAVSAYLLIGITFGLIYILIDHVAPGSFRDTIEPGKRFTPSEYTFFSFITLTTVGYGDIVPWASAARSVATIEAVIGIIYPALLISRLVGLHGRKQEQS